VKTTLRWGIGSVIATSLVGYVVWLVLTDAQGAHTASGDYVQVILLTALVVAVALPLYYYRNRVVGWFGGKQTNAVDGG
jgi:hypothetical protein